MSKFAGFVGTEAEVNRARLRKMLDEEQRRNDVFALLIIGMVFIAFSILLVGAL